MNDLSAKRLFAEADVEPQTTAAIRRHEGPVEIGAAHRTEADDLSALVAAIYDAALDPGLWPDVLDSCRAFIGGRSATIFAKDATGGAGEVYYADGHLDPHYIRLYFEEYGRIDPSNAAHLFAALEEPISNDDIFEPGELFETRFYKEWAAPHGLVDFIVAPIEKEGGWAAMFGVFRHERDGFVDDATRRRMRLLVPHIRRAVLIGKVLERGSSEAASFGDALDGLAAGMFLVDARGRLVHANAAGDALLAAADALRLRNGLITTADRAATDQLQRVFAAADQGDQAVGESGISVAIEGGDGERYVAHVLPLTSGARRRTAMSYKAVAALFVRRAALDGGPAVPEVIARTFGLTLSELRVLVAIVQVGGVAETAATLGIAEATVKTHLHRVFAKTGTSRQADLVKLVAGFASPLSR